MQITIVVDAVTQNRIRLESLSAAIQSQNDHSRRFMFLSSSYCGSLKAFGWLLSFSSLRSRGYSTLCWLTLVFWLSLRSRFTTRMWVSLFLWFTYSHWLSWHSWFAVFHRVSVSSWLAVFHRVSRETWLTTLRRCSLVARFTALLWVTSVVRFAVQVRLD